MLLRCKHLFCRHIWSVFRQILIYLAAKLGVFGGKTLPCTGIKEENAVRVYLKRQEQELPVAIEGCFVSNEACQNANASVCKMPLRNLVLFGTCSPFQVYMLYVDSQILYFRLSRAARWGIMLVFHLARGGTYRLSAWLALRSVCAREGWW